MTFGALFVICRMHDYHCIGVCKLRTVTVRRVRKLIRVYRTKKLNSDRINTMKVIVGNNEISWSEVMLNTTATTPWRI